MRSKWARTLSCKGCRNGELASSNNRGGVHLVRRRRIFANYNFLKWLDDRFDLPEEFPPPLQVHVFWEQVNDVHVLACAIKRLDFGMRVVALDRNVAGLENESRVSFAPNGGRH